jgi:hypothetical protein
LVLPKRLERHQQKCHHKTNFRKREKNSAKNTVDEVASQYEAPPPGKKLCGDCLRYYPKATFDFHRCRQRSSSVYTISAGLPGHGKRR